MELDFSHPQILSAVVAAAVALVVGLLTVAINASVTALTASRKVRADREHALSEKAWADYALRRDVYLDVAGQISCLFENGDATIKPELHCSLRKVRLVGSDNAVKALNAFTSAIRGGGDADVLEKRYRALFNAMRRDIRLLHTLPPEGTDLGDEAFPIES